MGLPKKIKKDINLYPVKMGYDRRVELLDDINRDGTYLPKSLLHADLDRGFLDFVKNNLKTVVDGKTVPVVDILITTQNWSQFTQTWNFNNLDKNVEPPIITTVRTPEVKYGSLPSLKYNIPNRKQFYYAAVPNFNNGRKGYDMYTIPQPVPVDIKYSVKIVCNRMRELNSFNKIVIENFASRQAYTVIKGHYIPITLDDVSDESVLDMEKRKYYIQNYNFTLQGFLLDENEFQVKPAVSRVLTFMETTTGTKRAKKPDNIIQNTNLINKTVNFPISLTSNTQTYEYTANIYVESSKNVSSYDVYINGIYYGSNISNSITGKIQVNTNDDLRFDIVKTDNSKESLLNLVNILL
jgi:hypothetical protein